MITARAKAQVTLNEFNVSFEYRIVNQLNFNSDLEFREAFYAAKDIDHLRQGWLSPDAGDLA